MSTCNTRSLVGCPQYAREKSIRVWNNFSFTRGPSVCRYLGLWICDCGYVYAVCMCVEFGRWWKVSRQGWVVGFENTLIVGHRVHNIWMVSLCSCGEHIWSARRHSAPRDESRTTPTLHRIKWLRPEVVKIVTVGVFFDSASFVVCVERAGIWRVGSIWVGLKFFFS